MNRCLIHLLLTVKGKGANFIARNSFIQISKLTNVKGRINYISSPARQENLYAVYETTDRKFWRELAKCNQEEFTKSGSKGNCIEAREFIIALPESFVEYPKDRLLKLFTEHFKQTYGTECIAALHHNKRKTNYHIHLIFSERKRLEKPIEKIAARNLFYDEKGRRVRTKKELLEENGQLRKGCKIIAKGEVYERTLFTVKDKRFKSETFLEEVKRSYTDLINFYVKEEKERLQVFQQGSIYLPMKKVGKNNPKAKEVENDNEMRKEWNQAVDRALISKIREPKILEVKQKEISEKIKQEVQKFGEQPQRFSMVVLSAIIVLEQLITKEVEKSLEKNFWEMKTEEVSSSEHSKVSVQKLLAGEAEQKRRIVETETGNREFFQEIQLKEKETILKSQPQPNMSLLASELPRLSEIAQKLKKQNQAIYEKEQELLSLEKTLDKTKGFFKGKQRKALQEQIDQLKQQIGNMKRYLSNIVQGYGYQTVQEFQNKYTASKAEYGKYQKEIAVWEAKTGRKAESNSLISKLKQKQQEAKERESKRQYPYKEERYYETRRTR